MRTAARHCSPFTAHHCSRLYFNYPPGWFTIDFFSGIPYDLLTVGVLSKVKGLKMLKGFRYASPLLVGSYPGNRPWSSPSIPSIPFPCPRPRPHPRPLFSLSFFKFIKLLRFLKISKLIKNREVLTIAACTVLDFSFVSRLT